MKKQLLVLFLAFFAISNLFAQNSPHDLPPECNGSAAEPSIGVEYQYTVTIPTDNPDYTADGTYHWYIFAKPNPAAAIDLLNDTPIADGTGFDVTVPATYDNPANTTAPISITWQSSALATGSYYLVINYAEENGSLALCSPNNLRVYEITPQNTFWLKIANASDAAGTAFATDPLNPSICPPSIASATMNTSGTIEYDYGTSTHYLKVSANGYVGNFIPELTLPTLSGMTYGDVTWSTDGGTTTHDFTAPSTGNIWTSTDQMPSINDFDATAGWGPGQEIVITIEIVHGTKELVADLPLEFAFNGSFVIGGTTYYDKYNAGTGNTCADDADANDSADRILLARPDVQPGTPGTFVTGNNVP